MNPQANDSAAPPAMTPTIGPVDPSANVPTSIENAAPRNS